MQTASQLELAVESTLKLRPQADVTRAYRKRIALTDRIKKAGRHVSQNEGLIFEQSAPGKRGVEFPPLDVPAVDARTALGADVRARRRRGISRSQRNRSDPPFHAPFHVELRDRPGHVPARLLHDEVQPARQRIRRAPRRHRHRASLPAAGTFARLPENSEAAAGLPRRNHGHGHRHARARGGRAGRTDRAAADSRLSRRHAGPPAQEGPDSRTPRTAPIRPPR